MIRGGCAAGWALFDTAFGRCALAWVEEGLTGLRLPGRDDAATTSGWPPNQKTDLFPDFVTRTIDGVQQHLAGRAHDLREVPLMVEGATQFDRRVYEAAREIDPGQICTYGELALSIGDPASARAVGAALGSNPWPIVVPCHRVVATGGKLGGFSAPGGSKMKHALVLLECNMAIRQGQLF